jgi:uncharacterized protein YyaL (SSP411 family)
MRYILVVAIVILISTTLYAKNSLSKESSPYLLQHADNPIDWYSWGKEPFLKAKQQNKKIFLSIGYSTCHWCHVMEEESFKDKNLAKLFNKYYISIKVDREEMPHLDDHFQQLYKKFLGKTGGWPLSVILDTEQNIYYIATYIPPKRRSYSEGLDTILVKYAKTDKLMKIDTKKAQKKDGSGIEFFKKNLLIQFDKIYGGFSRGKKYPEVSKLHLLLDIAQLQDDKNLYRYFYKTVDNMALRGLYDHVDGGFYRYTTDAAWEIPHFEKMLYTQAELINLYTRAYNLSGKKLYKKVVLESIDMLERRFAKDNLYYSASDADSEKGEGYYFTFSVKEVASALKENPFSEELKEQSEFCFDGNFHDRVHLNFYGDTRPKGFEQFRKSLQKYSKMKKFPFIDKKINTAWNSLMIESLYKAATIDKNYADLAKKHLEALLKMNYKDNDLYHQGVIGSIPKQKALLEDYSFLIAALIAAYEYDYDTQKLDFAEYLLSRAKELFYKTSKNSNKKEWYSSLDGLDIIASKSDKYYISAYSKMVQNIFKLASIKASFRYEKLAKESLQNRSYNTPALAEAYLIAEYGFVTVKSSKSNLVLKREDISTLNYPYILTKDEDFDDWLLCTMRRCFFKGDDFNNINKKIKLNLKQLKH